MSDPLFQLLRDDPRYTIDAYQFVRDALSYAHDELGWGQEQQADADDDEEQRAERHLSGQQLCEAIRQYAVMQYGLMAKVVLNSWGIYKTDDFGEIVYNLIDIELMKKSPEDQREHFHDAYDFDDAFDKKFEITMPDS